MNPVFNERSLDNVIVDSTAGTMTVSGAVSKTIFLTLLCAVSAAVAWKLAPLSPGLVYPASIGAAIVGLILVLITSFKPQTSPYIAPAYAIVEGIFLGAISVIFNAQMDGIVSQAVMLTFGILFAMLGLYQTGLIKVTARFRSIVIGATAGVMLFYVASIVLRAFGMPLAMMYDNSWLGIGFSLFVIGLAAFNFLIDFDLVERLAEARSPKYYEWFCGLGILVTLVWLYLEVLRLLARSRD